MRDLILSVLIGSVVVVGATDFAGVTTVFHGRNPASAIRDAVPVQDLPSLPALPSLPSIPDARTVLGGAAATATGTAIPAPQMMYVAHTNGSGVRPRLACADDAPGQGVITEGSAVTVLRQGASDCPGWALVASGKIEFWVRMAYVDGSAPKAASPGKPADAGKAPAAPVLPPQAKGDPAGSQGRPTQDPKAADVPEPTPAPAPAPTVVPTPAATPSQATATATQEPRKHTPVPTPTEEPREDEN